MTMSRDESIEVLQEPSIHAERRLIYVGDAPTPTEEFPSRGNRPVKRRKRSSFNIITALLAVSALTVFYVWNKISVNRLVIEVSDLQNRYEKILNSNEFLRAEINKKSSLERIGKIASGQLGLVPASEQPRTFEVDPDQLEQFQH